MSPKKPMDQNVATKWSRDDRDLLIELKTKMEGVVDSIGKLEKAISTRESDHETRIRGLEKQRWGFAAGISTLATAIASSVAVLVK